MRYRRFSALGTSSLTALVLIALTARERPRIPRRWVGPVAAVGLCDVGANALFALAKPAGRSCCRWCPSSARAYPVVTVVLAHVFLGERLSRVQLAAVGLALAGVCALAGS